MKTIKVLDIIQKTNAMSRITGGLVFDFLKSELENDQIIHLSFSGLENCTVSFINASIGKLYTTFGKNIASKMIIIDVEKPFWQALIDEQILLATDKLLADKHQKALESVIFEDMIEA